MTIREQMTSSERILAALNGEPLDHIPFSPFLAYVWETFPNAIRDEGQLAFHRAIGADPLWRGAPCPVKAILPTGVDVKTREDGERSVTVIATPVGTLRSVHARSANGNTTFLVEHPLKREEDYKVQMWIEEHTTLAYDPEPVRQHFQGEGREGFSLGMLIPRGKSSYQSMVENLVGTEELIYGLADYPDTVRALWQQMVGKDLEAVRLAIEAEYTHFITWEDSSTQNYSPTQYDEYIGSEIGQWCGMLRRAGKQYVQHACGHVSALVERMAKHGVFAIESLSPPPTGNLTVERARALVGPSMGIIGGIEPTRFLNLEGEALTNYVESVFQEAQGGPFVLANSDSCPPGVTVEKFRQVAEIARRLRRP